MQSTAVTAGTAATQSMPEPWHASVLQRMGALLARLLHPDEKPILLARSGPPREGIARLFSSSRRYVLVMTRQRMLCVAVSGDMTPLESVSEVAWGDVASATASPVMRRLRITYRSGRRESFAITSRRDVARVREFLASISGEATADLERRYLCPDCGQRVPEAVAACANCGLTFRSMRNAVRFALWYPGGGYFFLRNTPLGLLGIAIEAFLLIALRSAYRISAVGRIEHPVIAYGAIVGIWISWKVTTALHVAAAAREPIADRNAAKRESHLPPAIARSMVESTVSAGAAASAAIGTVGREAITAAVETASAEARDLTGALRADDFTQPGDSIDPAVRERILTPQSWHGVPFAWGYLLRQIVPGARAELLADQMKSVEKLRSALVNLLDSGEVVVYITPGATPFSIADYFGPVLFLYFIRRCYYVFTDRRMIVVPVTMDDAPLPNVSVVPYSDIAGYRFTAGYAAGFLMNFKIQLAYANGQSETFNRFPFEHFQRLQALLPRFIALAQPQSGRPRLNALRQRHHLCPFCGATLRRNVFRCFGCGSRYRSRKTAAWLAALVPGAGFFYTGRPRLGILDAALQMFLIANLAGVAVAAAAGSIAPYRTPLLIYAVLLLVNKVVSVYQAAELAGEYILAQPPPRGLQPRVSAPVDEHGWILTTFIVAAGVVMIVAAVAVRLPLYAKQWELSHLAPTIDSARMERATADMERMVTRLKQLDRELTRLERFTSVTSYRSFRDPDLPFLVLQFPDDPQVDSMYQRTLAEYRPLYLDYRKREPEYKRDVAEYNKKVRRARELEDDIGDAWTSFNPKDVARDLFRRVGPKTN